MARAYFSCHECGESVAVYGSTRREADRLADWHASQEHLCAACRRAELERENQQAAEHNAAAGLPPLTGSDKQAAWAESIRARKLDTLDRARRGELSDLERISFVGTIDLSDPAVPALVDALRGQTSASWWIDRRDRKTEVLLEELARTQPPTPSKPDPIEAELAAAALAEATVRPTDEITATVAEIRLIGERIEIVFPEKREDFRQLIRYELGYAWSGTAWGRVITDRSGPLADRVIEAGHRLLSAGFPIRLQDADLRARAVAGDYAPEQKRWITGYTAGKYQGWLCLQWPKDDNIYTPAHRLPGCRYDKPNIAVPPASFDAIEDFAEAYQFAISDTARRYLDAARTAHESALIVEPARVAPSMPESPNLMPEATGEIDPDLLDD
ncbi:MAG: hypothetical protein MZV65_28500 [Chromatiales bacterium]|nr:hypothetical protein [Chromatiales bacterium]